MMKSSYFKKSPSKEKRIHRECLLNIHKTTLNSDKQLNYYTSFIAPKCQSDNDETDID